MNRTLILAVFSSVVAVGCSTTTSQKSSTGSAPPVAASTAEPYQPATKAEKYEFTNDRLDFYPDDYRKDPTNSAGITVAWAGIIKSTDANERDNGSQIFADTVFEHHYFDWVQEKGPKGIELSVSPRGEGLFKMRWLMDKTGNDSTAYSAEDFAGPGKLAIVYGVPQKVEADGTIVMHYKYLRIIDQDHFNTNEFDYGRLGEPFHSLHPASPVAMPASTPSTTAKGG